VLEPLGFQMPARPEAVSVEGPQPASASKRTVGREPGGTP
jgi:hypothetical protein